MGETLGRGDTVRRRRGEAETGRCGDAEMRRCGDAEMGRCGDGEMRRWGEAEMRRGKKRETGRQGSLDGLMLRPAVRGEPENHQEDISASPRLRVSQSLPSAHCPLSTETQLCLTLTTRSAIKTASRPTHSLTLCEGAYSAVAQWQSIRLLTEGL